MTSIYCKGSESMLSEISGHAHYTIIYNLE